MCQLRMLLIILFSLAVFFSCSSDEEKKADYLKSGMAYFEKEDYKSAEIEFKNAVQIDPQCLEAYINLAKTCLRTGNARGAFKAYSRASQIDPKNIDVQLKLATFMVLGKKIK